MSSWAFMLNKMFLYIAGMRWMRLLQQLTVVNVYISIFLLISLKAAPYIANHEDSILIKQFRMKATNFLGQNNDSSLIVSNQMMDFARSKQMLYYISDAWDLNSQANELMGHLEKSVLATDSAMYYARFFDDPVGVIYFSINKGSLHMKAGHYFEALQSYEQARQLAEDEGKPDRVVASLNNIGAVYHYLGDDENALRYFIQSYEMRVKYGLTDKLAYAFNNIGAIYSKYGDQSSALTYHNKALETARQQNDLYNIRVALTNLGLDNKKLKRYPEALSYFEEALQAAIQSNELSEQAHVLEQTGLVFIETNQTDDAIKFFERALIISNKSNVQHDIASLSLQLGKLYLKSNKTTESLTMLERSMQISLELGSIHLKQQVSEALNDYYYKSGDQVKARHFQQLNQALLDSIYKTESDLKIANLKNQFELNNRVKELELKNEELNKEQEKSKLRLMLIYSISIVVLILIGSMFYIVLLFKKIRRQNRIILEKEKQLNELLANEIAGNKLKSTLISTVNHEFRTPLAILSSNVQLLTDYRDTMSKEMQLESFEYIERSMNNLLQMLDNFTAADVTSILHFEPERVNVTQLCYNLVKELQSIQGIGKRILITSSVSESMKCVDPLLITHILRNLLNNALKFSAGQIVDLRIEEDLTSDLIFVIADKGIGINAKDQTKIFDEFYRASNAASVKGTGIGLSVVKRAVGLHKGTITIESKEGEGTTVTVRLPGTLTCSRL